MADLLINITPAADPLSLNVELEGSKLSGYTGPFRIDRATLREQNRRTYSWLEEFAKGYSPDASPTRNDLDNCLYDLTIRSAGYLDEVFQDDLARLRRHLHQTLGHATLERPARLEVRCSFQDFLLVGMWSVRQHGPQSSIMRNPLYNDRVRDIIGFSCLVQYVLRRDLELAPSEAREAYADTGYLPQGDFLGDSLPLRVAFLKYLGIAGADKEQQTLVSYATGQDRRVEMVGTYPDPSFPPAHLPRRAGEQVLAQWLASPNELASPDVLAPQVLEGRGVHIMHISAHAEVQHGQDGAFSWIALRRQGLTGNTDDFKLESDLFASLGLGSPMVGGPLAVLSACQSGVLAGSSKRSLVGRFLGYGYRAVVGSEAKVKGSLAAAFMSLFYEGFLRDSMTVGTAMHNARIALLRKNNPFGILFTAYGNTALTPTKTRKREQSWTR
jgi:hypothetical protein